MIFIEHNDCMYLLAILAAKDFWLLVQTHALTMVTFITVATTDHLAGHRQSA